MFEIGLSKGVYKCQKGIFEIRKTWSQEDINKMRGWLIEELIAARGELVYRKDKESGEEELDFQEDVLAKCIHEFLEYKKSK